MICPICKTEVAKLLPVDQELNSQHKIACPSCLRSMWNEYDDNEIFKRKATARQKKIADIANEMGADVTPDDVQLVFKAAQIEFESRTGRTGKRKAKGQALSLAQ